MDRGILSTIYTRPQNDVSAEDALQAIDDFYADHPFVRVTPDLPATKHVSGTNFCDITVRSNRGMLVLISALDNLIKGASGAAVQNFNMMFGFQSTTALL